MSKNATEPQRGCRLCMATRFFKRSVNIFNDDFNYADVIQEYTKIEVICCQFC